MLKTLRTKKTGGFTLVEIMIVVAIIALLASIGVPNFLRARKRAQATSVLEDLRLVESAKDQWAIETNKVGNAAVTWNDVQPYIKPGTRLATGAGTDAVGGTITLSTVDQAVKVSTTTKGNFTDIFKDTTEESKFWGVHDAAAPSDP